MNPTESIRLTPSEANILLVGAAYNMASLTFAYNKAKVMALSLGTAPQASATPPATPNPNAENAETSLNDKAKTISREKLESALKEIHTLCKEDLSKFPQKLKQGINVQARLLSAMDSKTALSLSLSSAECEFAIESLRCFEQAEINPVSEMEVVLASVMRLADRYGDDATAVTQSSRRTKEDWKATQATRDEFICLMAKVINYGKTLATGVNPNNDQ